MHDLYQNQANFMLRMMQCSTKQKILLLHTNQLQQNQFKNNESNANSPKMKRKHNQSKKNTKSHYKQKPKRRNRRKRKSGKRKHFDLDGELKSIAKQLNHQSNMYCNQVFYNQS